MYIPNFSHVIGVFDKLQCNIPAVPF